MTKPIQECEFLEKCPIFNRFRTEGAKNVWIGFYCKGVQQSSCVRRLLKKAGKEVPITLLPNGSHLKDLKDKSE
jgi:hypothetical protein